MGVIVVTGTPGAGKTSVLQGALQKLGSEYKVVNYGDEMLSVAIKKKIVKHRDELRKQPPAVQKKIQKQAAQSIAAKAKKAKVIVDTHCLIKTSRGYLPGLPAWVLQKLMPEEIILIEADSNEIAQRRASDATRVRDADPIGEIEEHQQMNRAIACSYAMLTGATVRLIKNNNGKLEEAVEAMVSAMR